MKKIICPTDFSKAATNAVEYAALIAGKTGASVTLVHTVHLPMLDTTETAMVAAETLGEQKKQAADKLHALCRYLIEKHHEKQIEINYLVKEAFLGDAILQLTASEGFDMVVIGSTGGGNTLEEILIGSNTESVIEKVKCPVLTVPLNAAPVPFKHLVYASDYHQEDIAALKEVLLFASLFEAKVEVVHVSKEESVSPESEANIYRQKLREALVGHDLSFQEVVHPNPVEGMKGYLTQTHGDLLVILKKRKGFFHNIFSQSFSEKLTYQSKLPMLIIHA